MGKNIVVYDLEIKHPINEPHPKTGQRIGWGDFSKMGISVGCAFDYRDYCFKFYMDDNICDLATRLNEDKTLVVGFAIEKFDNKVMRADPIAGKIPLKPDNELNMYDMLLESRKGAGVANNAGGFKLDDHLRACKLPMKTDNGAEAPGMWIRGELGKLCSYVLNDAKVEKMKFDFMYVNGFTACAASARHNVRIPDISGL